MRRLRRRLADVQDGSAASDEDVNVYNHEPPDYRCPYCLNVTTGESRLGAGHDHHENVYDLPVEFGTPIQRAVRSAAIAMKTAFGCTGVSTRQHNEPDGCQDVWHYHVHVLPRWRGDRLDASNASLADADELHHRAELLRQAWPKA